MSTIAERLSSSNHIERMVEARPLDRPSNVVRYLNENQTQRAEVVHSIGKKSLLGAMAGAAVMIYRAGRFIASPVSSILYMGAGAVLGAGYGTAQQYNEIPETDAYKKWKNEAVLKYPEWFN